MTYVTIRREVLERWRDMADEATNYTSSAARSPSMTRLCTAAMNEMSAALAQPEAQPVAEALRDAITDACEAFGMIETGRVLASGRVMIDAETVAACELAQQALWKAVDASPPVQAEQPCAYGQVPSVCQKSPMSCDCMHDAVQTMDVSAMEAEQQREYLTDALRPAARRADECPPEMHVVPWADVCRISAGPGDPLEQSAQQGEPRIGLLGAQLDATPKIVPHLATGGEPSDEYTLSDFRADQWWVAELDACATAPDQRRAMAVLRRLLRALPTEGEPSDEAIRAAFEAWIKNDGREAVDVTRSSSGHYRDLSVHSEWLAFDAGTRAVLALKPPSWIACSERMPGIKEHVLVAAEFDGPGDWRIKLGRYQPDHSWLIYGGSWTPTHWMPLPAAPQHGGSDD